MKTFDTAVIELLLPSIEKMIDEKLKRYAKDKTDDEPPFLIHDELPLTTEVLAERMGLSKSYLYQEVSKGNIPYHKRCKRLYFIPSEIRDWVKGTWKNPDVKKRE